MSPCVILRTIWRDSHSHLGSTWSIIFPSFFVRQHHYSNLSSFVTWIEKREISLQLIITWSKGKKNVHIRASPSSLCKRCVLITDHVVPWILILHSFVHFDSAINRATKLMTVMAKSEKEYTYILTMEVIVVFRMAVINILFPLKLDAWWQGIILIASLKFY